MTTEANVAPTRTIRVLFVDKDEAQFAAMMQNLADQCTNLQTAYKQNASEALDYLAHCLADVVISGPKVPGVQEPSFLREVRNRFPSVLRFVLATEKKEEAIAQSGGVAHQSVSRTINAEELFTLLQSSVNQLVAIKDSRVTKVLSRLEGLPNRSAMMTDFLSLLSGATPSVEKISATVSKHPGMVARLIKIANSPIFGNPGRITCLDDAIGLLGLDMIASLFFSMQVLTMDPPSRDSRLEVESLWTHCVQVSVTARKLGMQAKFPSASIRAAVTAALLHDVGKLVMAHAMPLEFAAASIRAEADKMPMWFTERPIFGNTHADIGACLLKVWGFPANLVEAVHHHHSPHRCSEEAKKSALLIHIADAVVHSIAGKSAITFIDENCLKASGLSTDINYWIDLAPLT